MKKNNQIKINNKKINKKNNNKKKIKFVKNF